MYTCVSIWYMCAGTHGGWKKVSVPLKRVFQVSGDTQLGCWELSSASPEEQQAPLTAEQPFRSQEPPVPAFFDRKNQNKFPCGSSLSLLLKKGVTSRWGRGQEGAKKPLRWREKLKASWEQPGLKILLNIVTLGATGDKNGLWRTLDVKD